MNERERVEIVVALRNAINEVEAAASVATPNEKIARAKSARRLADLASSKLGDVIDDVESKRFKESA